MLCVICQILLAYVNVSIFSFTSTFKVGFIKFEKLVSFFIWKISFSISIPPIRLDWSQGEWIKISMEVNRMRNMEVNSQFLMLVLKLEIFCRVKAQRQLTNTNLRFRKIWKKLPRRIMVRLMKLDNKQLSQCANGWLIIPRSSSFVWTLKTAWSILEQESFL